VELPETWQNNLAQVIGFYPPERLLPSELPIGAVLEFFGLVQKQLPHLKRIKVDVGWEYYSKFLEDAKEDPELLVLGFEPNLWTWRRAIETAKSELHVGLPCGGNQGCVFIFPFLVGDFGGRAQLLRSGSFAGCNTILQIRAFDAATLRPHALRRCRSLLEQGVRIPADHFKNATQNGDHAGPYYLRAADLERYTDQIVDEAAMCVDGFDEQQGNRVMGMDVPSVSLGMVFDIFGDLDITEVKIDAQGLDFDIFWSSGRHIRRVEKVTMETQDLQEGEVGLLHEGALPRSALLVAMNRLGFVESECELNSCAIMEYDCTFVNPAG
jgi:hypothetical protein